MPRAFASHTVMLKTARGTPAASTRRRKADSTVARRPARRKPEQQGQPAHEEESEAPLADQPYTRLEELIVTLQLAPGTAVTEAQLSELLGIGRTPIREALQRLAAQRLV